jgi:hypothetical protein
MANEFHERVPSPAKAEVARQKPRDAQGKFLSGADLENYRAQQQAIQFQNERDKMSNLLGRGNAMPQTNMPQQIPGLQNNFQTIISANKIGGSTSQSEDDKWNMLLGKRKNR